MGYIDHIKNIETLEITKEEYDENTEDESE